MNLTPTSGAVMVHRGREKIICTASLLSVQCGTTVPGYTAANLGVAGLTTDRASPGVDAITPGYTATDNTQAPQDAAITARIPAARWGTVNDLVGATVFLATVFLASKSADYVNGIVLPVDGGWLGR